jgi:hypothetical protein
VQISPCGGWYSTGRNCVLARIRPPPLPLQIRPRKKAARLAALIACKNFRPEKGLLALATPDTAPSRGYVSSMSQSSPRIHRRADSFPFNIPHSKSSHGPSAVTHSDGSQILASFSKMAGADVVQTKGLAALLCILI